MKTLKISTITMLATAVLLFSCQKEDIADEINQEQIESDSEDFNKRSTSKRYVMVKVKKGKPKKMMTVKEYRKWLKKKRKERMGNNRSSKSSSKNSGYIEAGKRALDKGQLVSLFKKYDLRQKAENKWGGYIQRIQTGCAESTSWRSGDEYVTYTHNGSHDNGWCWDPATWFKTVFKESEVTNTEVKKGFSRTAEVRRNFGHPNKELSLAKTVAKTTTESTTSSVSRASTTASNWNYKIGVKVSTKILGIGTDFSAEYGAGGSTSDTETFVSSKTSSTTQNFVWTEDAFVPAGKQCDMYLKYQKVAERFSYKLYTKVHHADFWVRKQEDNGTFSEWLDRGNGPELYPAPFRENKVYDIVEWDDERFEFWVEKKNCKNYQG